MLIVPFGVYRPVAVIDPLTKLPVTVPVGLYVIDTSATASSPNVVVIVPVGVTDPETVI